MAPAAGGLWSFLLIAVVLTLFALPSRAQSVITSYADDFQSYGTQKNPAGWVDTAVGSSKPAAAGLYKTWPDPAQSNGGTNVVFGTKQASGKPEGNNPRIGTFSTYTAKSFNAAGRFEYKGRFLRTTNDARVGLTFLSSYPETDRYYLLGLWSHPSGNLTMQLFGFGGGTPSGTTVSDFSPLPGKWYAFLIRVDDVDGKTVIRARFWLDTNLEPSTWNIDAADSSATRLTSGRIGIWSAVRGDAYVDDLSATSPVDHAPPTIAFFADDKPLTDGLAFNHVITPKIVVTDDLSGANWTATLDGKAYPENTPVTEQGQHVLTVTAVDAVGNRTSKSVTFSIDTIPPVVTIVKPANGSMTADDVLVALNVVDASLPYTVAATLDDHPFDVRNSITTEGLHTLVVTVTDAVGLVSLPATTRFTIDRSDPAYELLANGAPLTANKIFDRDVVLTVNTHDLTPVTVKLILDEGTYTQGATIADERKHTIRGTITDSVGHTTTIAPIDFWIDKTAPVVTLLGNDEPLKDLYDVASLVVSVQADDITATHVNATLNGAPFTSPSTLTNELEYELKGTVTDDAGHSTPFGPRKFAIDRSAPQIVLQANGQPFPASGHIFTGDVTITLEVRDLTLSETTATLDGAVIASFPLVLGDEFYHHVIKVVAADKLNHTASAGPFEFTIDKLAPLVTVTNPLGTTIANDTFFREAVTPVINVVDISHTTIDAKLNGQPFTSGTPVTTDGAYTLTGTVTDEANRQTPVGPLTFTIDTVAPVGVFVEGENNPFPDGKSVNVDAIRAWVRVTDANPLPATILLDGAPYSEKTPITSEDAHTLTATLADKAGNSGTVPPVTFRIDRTAPQLTLFAFGDLLGSHPIETHLDVPVTFDAQDPSRPIAVTGILDGHEIALPYTITAEGEHTLSGQAVDAAGNTGTAGPYTIRLEKTPPSVEVLLNGEAAGVENVFNTAVSVTLRISSGITSQSVSILVDGAAYVAGTPVDGEREHVVSGTVTTGSGLVVNIPETVFTIDKTAPAVTLKNRDDAFEANGFHYNSDVVPNVTCTDDLTRCTVELTVDGASWTSGDPITAEGPHVVVAGAVDRAGNRRTLDPVDFIIDKTPPALTITAPTDGQVLSVANTIVRGAADDAVSVTVSGTPAAVDRDAKTYASPSLNLAEGENELTVEGLDQAGNPAAPQRVKVVVDTRAPGLGNIQPPPNACLAANDVTVTGTVTDPSITAVKVSLDDRVVANALDAQKASFTAPFASVTEGAHRITIEATDALGHRTVNAIQIVVDRGAPAIDVLEGGTPLARTLFNRPVALTFRARDIDPNVQLAVTLNGNAYRSGTTLTAEGAYHFDAVAHDCAGNQFVLPVDLALDLTPPLFDTLTPAPNATVGSASAITGHVSNDAVEVAIDNTSLVVTPDAQGRFTLPATFAEGTNAYVLRATDAAGNVTRLPYAFTLRGGAPSIEILESGAPLADNALFNRPVRPAVQVSDPGAHLLVLINGQTDNGEPLTADGTYTIVATADDDLQRTAEARRTFTIDRTPPVITIQSPQPGDAATATVDLYGTAGDAVTLNVHGAEMTPNAGGTFRRNAIPLDLGTNELVVTGTDRAGNTGTGSVIVNWRGDGPAILITQPADHSLTNRPRIDVAGRVLAPLAGGTIIVGSKTVSLDAASSFRATDYQLADGDNEIVVRLPNGPQVAVHVTADFKPPTLNVLVSGQPLGDNAQFPSAVAITVNATDDRELELTRFTVDGTEGASPFNVSATGGHVLSAIARDRAGNETRIERTFFIGATSTAGGCTIENVDPANNATVAPAANATVTTVRVTGRASGATAVSVGNVNADLADGTFAATIELPLEGANQFDLRCKDASNKLSDPLPLTYFRVSGNPSVRITAPAEGGVTAETTVTVRGEVGADVVEADVNGKRATITEGTPRTFVVQNVTLVPGVNVLVAHARNGAYRYGSHSVRVRSEQAQPSIRITQPQSNATAGGLKATVSGTYANVRPSTLAIGGGASAPSAETLALSDTTGIFVFRDVDVVAGPNTLTVSGRNDANANASAAVVVNGDASVPAIAITQPLDNAWLAAENPIDVTGRYANAAGTPRVEINGQAADVDESASSYSGTAQHSATSPLTPVSARLRAADGTGPAATITVHKLAGPLRIVNTFPEDGAQGIDPAAVVLINFSAPLDRDSANNIHLTKDGANVGGTLRVEDTVAVFTPSTLLESGAAYRVDIPLSVRDVAGHPLAQAASIAFTTLATAPSVPPAIDPIAISGCPGTVEIHGTAPAFARLLLETGYAVPFDGTAGADGRFTIRFPLSGRSGYQSGRLYVIAADGSRSPAAPVTFRVDCAGPQVIGASFDRDGNVITIAFSKSVAPATITVGPSSSIVLNVSDGTSPSGTPNVSGANATIVPADDLRAKSFTLEIRTTVTDTAGNALAVPFSQTFSIGGDEQPIPGDGSGFVSGEVYDAGTGRPLANVTVASAVPASAFARVPSVTSNSVSTRYTIVGTPTRPGKVATTATEIEVSRTTDERGRYVFALPEGAHTIEASSRDYTTVWRQIVVPAGAGVIPIDIRVQRRGAATLASALPLTLENGGGARSVTRPIKLIVNAGVAPDAKVAATSVGAQSLAGLLPLGWSPFASAEVAVFGADGSLVSGAPLTADLEFTLPSAEIAAAQQTLSFVQYDAERDEWRTLVPAMTATSGDTWRVAIQNAGAYAVVYRDLAGGLNQPPAAAAGVTLQPAAKSCDPCTLTRKDFNIDPPMVAPSETAVATLQIEGEGTNTFPSGTAVQAYVSEVLHLSDGGTVVDPPFTADVLLYRGMDGKTGLAEFVIAPSQTARSRVLESGVDQVRILHYPGRLDRGSLIGSEGGRVPGDDTLSLEIPSGATTEQLHATVATIPQNELGQTIDGFDVVTGFTFSLARAEEPAPSDVDNDGVPDAPPPVELSRAARATIAIDTAKLASPDAQLILAEVVTDAEWGSIYRLATPMVRLDAPQNGVTTVRFTTRAIDSELPIDGIAHAGRYLVLAAKAPIAIATGVIASQQNGPAVVGARIASTMPAGNAYGVVDVTRSSGIFALPIAATPATTFALTPREPRLGTGRAYTAAAPAPGAIVHVSDWTFEIQPLHLVDYSPRDGQQVPAAAIAITAQFDLAIDPASLGDAIRVTNADGNLPLGGAAVLDSANPKIIRWTSTGQVAAGATYSVTLQGSIRATNGARFGPPLTYSVTTAPLPRDGTVKPDLIHITMPDENGLSRIYGTAGAIPPSWRVNVLRPGRGFRSAYGAGPNPDGSFSVVIGGNDPYDRITIEDLIDLEVLNSALNVAVTLRMPTFVTADGKGFVARPEKEATFTTAQGLKVVVAAGTFDKPTLITTDVSTSPDAFAGVPNFANELAFHRAITIDFDGTAQKKIDLSFPINGLPTTGNPYILGYADESTRGPRVSIASLLIEDGDQFTTRLPDQGSTSGARRVASSSNMSFPTISAVMSCMPGVMQTGTYGMMQLTPPGGGLIGWATVNEMRTLDMFNSAFTSLFMPGYAHYSRACATIPVVAGKEFTIVGVDPTTGTEVFEHTYPGIDDPDTVVALPNPMPDRVGPFPIYATPFRVEQVDVPPLADTNGDNIPDTGLLITRGLKVEFFSNGALKISKAPFAPAAYVLPEKTTVQFFDVTKSRHSNVVKVGANGAFTMTLAGAEAGDLIYVYLSAADVGPDTLMSVVLSEPVDVGPIPNPTDAADTKRRVDQFLHGVVKFEQVVTGATVDLTNAVTFEALSENRRIRVNMPSELVRGGLYRLTLKSTMADSAGNKLGERKDASGNVEGDTAADISMDFVVRDAPDVQNEFELRSPSDTNPAAGLRDMARYGNLVFVAGMTGGLFAYDIAEPSSLKGGAGGSPKPIAGVPAAWKNGDLFIDGAAPMFEFWTVAADQHGRIYGGGFGGGVDGQFSLIRSYRVEDFLDARDNGSTGDCTGAAASDHLNCRRYGTAIVGWRPASLAGSLMGVSFATNQPTAYVRKLKLLEQDENVTNPTGAPAGARTFSDLESGLVSDVQVLSSSPIVSGSEFKRATLRVGFGGLSAPSGSSYLIQRVTVMNVTLDMRWHADVYKGETADIKNVVARDGDTMVVLRNQTTYGVVTLFGYGAAVYDLNAVETNGVAAHCADAAFRGAHSVCPTAILQTKLPEKLVVTNLGEQTACDSGLMGYDEDMRYAPEVFGIVRTNYNPVNGATVGVSPDMTLFALTGAKSSLLDMRVTLPSASDPNTASCATPGDDVPPEAGYPWMTQIAGVAGSWRRTTNGATYRWHVTAEENPTGLRGSMPGTDVTREYLLVAANDMGVVIYEIGGTRPVNGKGYWPLSGEQVVDTIWVAAGAQAVSVIEGTDLAAIIDRKGRLLIADLSNIDERWGPVPATAGTAASFNADPFKLPTLAALTPTTVPGEKGVNDPRIIYMTKDPFAFGVMPPLVAGDTGIALGGEMLGTKMRVRPVLDPKVEFLIDAGDGKGLQSTGKIIPLGVPYPKSAATAEPGSLGAFRVRVTLPGAIANALPASQMHLAVESELVAGGIAQQTPRSLPRAHLRLNDRAGQADKRKVDFLLERVVPNIPTQEKEFRHQRGYNKLISPWVVAIADPRASERVLDAVQNDGCTQCKRPSKLQNKTEADGVFEMYTNGRFVSARIDGNTPNVLPADSLPAFYDYLAEKSRFQSRVATVIADTARPKSTLVAAQAPPVAQGTLDGTIYVHSGELQVGAGDLTLLGRGAANLQLARAYRSHIIGGSSLGLGWEATFLRRLRELPNGDVEYRDGAGDIWLFKLPPNTTGGAAATPGLDSLESAIGTRLRYDSPPGLFYGLKRTDDGWTLLDSKWRVTRFDNLGRLSAESDEFWKAETFGAAAQGGNLFRYFYGADGRLAQIVDPLYRVTTISYYDEGAPNTDCTDLGSKTTPCGYPGLIKEISDWRGRSLLFEYDRVGRLIGVQAPKVDAVAGAPSDYDFSTDTKRPRVHYTYAGGDTFPAENAGDQEFTDFMQYAANLESITDASQESSGQRRVTYDWFKNNDPTRDHVKTVQWPCASYVSSCSPKQADLTYSGDTTKITDLMDQKWEYTLTDGPDQRKHIASMVALEVPTYNAAAGTVPTLTLPGEPASLTTSYSNFDPNGIPLKTTLPSGRTIDLTVQPPPANTKAHCQQVTSVKESGSGASRETKINYDDKPTALCSQASIERNGEKRETESPHRDRKKTSVIDTRTHVETETQYDDYGRPTMVSEKDTSGGSPGTTTIMGYKSNLGDQIGWGRLATVADAANTVTENYDYFKDGAGQKVVETDQKRDITKTTRYNALDQPVYRQVRDGRFGVLSEEFMAYDADGRLAWSRRTGPSGTNYDVTTKFDALGREISTKSTGNSVDGNPNTTLEVTQTYDLVTKQLVTNDPSTSGGTGGGKQITTIDTMGRPTRVERSSGSVSLLQVYAYDAHGLVSYQGDTARTALTTVRDGLGHAIENTANDGVTQKVTWSEWDQPSETTVIAGGTTISHTKQLFTDEGVPYAFNEQIDSRIRQTLLSWKDGGTNELTRVGETATLDEDELSAVSQIRGILTKKNASGLLTEISTGESAASSDTVTDIFHTTEYTAYRGDEPQSIIEHEPKRNTSVTYSQQLDGLNRVRSSTIGGEYETTSTYDVAGNLRQVTPAGLGTTTTEHDARGLAYRVQRPGSAGAIERKFDALGALREIRDETGDVTTYVTDGLGRVTEIRYPDVPQTTEQLKYENVSGLLIAQRDRAGNWLSYSYDDGGRITKIHDGEDPASAPVIQLIEYDAAKRIKRIANKDAAIEYDDYDLLGRAQTTRSVRYANGTGTKTDPGDRITLDVHTQTHTYSIFDGERTSWRMPTAGAAIGTNGGAWRNEIREHRDAGTNLIEQRADSVEIANAAGAGDGRISKHSRATSAGAWIETTYQFADSTGSGLTSADPSVGISGTLIEALTKRGNTTLAGTHTYPDKSLRVGGARDLALGRSSRWIYDQRGRLTNGKLLVPSKEIDTLPGTDDTLTDAGFRSDRQLVPSLSSADHAQLGDALSFALEPLPWHADEQSGHQIDKRTIFLDATSSERDYSFDGGRRSSDGVWSSTYDKFGRLESIESTSLQRRIEYVYGPDDRVVGRKAIDLNTGVTEMRSAVLASDALPAESTFVWDPISDRLLAIYKTGESVGGGTSAPAGEAGLVRQYVPGDNGYDDVVDVLVATTPGGTPARYIPIFDQAGTDSLQAVADGDGHLVERVLYGDSWGDAPRYLHGAIAEKVSFSAKRNQLGQIEEVHVSVRVSENVNEATVTGGYRLAAVDDDGTVLETYAQPPQFADVDDHHEVRWTLSAIAWQDLISNPSASGIEVVITSSLRTEVWGDEPIQEVPEWAQKIYSVTSDKATSTPMIVRASFATLATAPANGDEIKLFSIDNLYLAASPDSRTHILTGFKASPFVEPATGLAYFRARWYDPSTGTWLTPDPIGYQDSSDLYAFCGDDPINCADPLGLESLGQLVHGWSEDAFESGNWLAIAGATLGETVYAAFEFASAGAVGKIDAAQEALDRGDITQGEYWKRTTVAVAQTAASYAVGGIAGKAGAQLTRGLVSRMLQGAAAGAIGGVSGTFASDVIGVAAGTQEHFTSWQGYAGSGAFGAAFGGLEGYKIATRPGYNAEVSEYGESLARRFLRRSGLTDVEGIQNASGHGIDVAATDPVANESVFAEVKASRGDTAPALSKAQQNARTFVTSRLSRAANRGFGFKNVDPAVRARAVSYLASVRANGGNVRGLIIEVLNVGTTKQRIVVRTW